MSNEEHAASSHTSLGKPDTVAEDGSSQKTQRPPGKPSTLLKKGIG